MGNLIGKKIVQTRTYIDPDAEPILEYDYYKTYPISVFEGIKKTDNDNSSNLVDEFEAVDIKLAAKQDMIPANVVNSIVTYTDEDGKLGKRNVVNTINPDPRYRNAQNIPSEVAVGLYADSKADSSEFYKHIENTLIHLDEDDRKKLEEAVTLDQLIDHTGNDGIHVTPEQKEEWSSKADGDDFENHINDYNNPHRVTTGQINTYNRPEIDAMIKAAQTNFFNYLNVLWDKRTSEVKLVRYSPENWDPNYILQYDDPLPQIEDHSKTYFAVKPFTDHTVNNTNDVLIFIKDPVYFPTWTEIAIQTLNEGDLLVRYPDGALFMWLLGHFVEILTRDGGLVPGDFLTEVSHDPTLSGRGTLSAPLGIPLNSIGSNLIKLGSVTNLHIENRSITGLNIANDTVTISNLSPDIREILASVGVLNIEDGSILSRHLAVNSVVTAKIMDGNVTTPKLADGAVTTTKIKNGAVTSVKIAQNSITHDHLSVALRSQIDYIYEIVANLDGYIKVTKEIILPASQWVRMDDVYTQTIQIPDLTDKWAVTMGQKLRGRDRDGKVRVNNEFNKISYVEPLTGALYLECWDSPPLENLTVTITYEK